MGTLGSARGSLAPSEPDAGDGHQFTIASAGRFDYDAQFFPLVPSLENGKRYTLAFEARTDQPGEMVVMPEQFHKPFLPTGLPLQKIDLTREWKSWEFTWTATNGDKGPIKMPAFRRGLSAGTVWVRNVTLKEAE